MTLVEHWELRARFARSLSDLYGKEVPAYTTLVEVSSEVNADYKAKYPELAERLGSIERVTAERHGAIRVGNIEELSQAARVFGACGMHPVGFYDLRDANPPIPVISTAFRPVDRGQLAKNPFRVFTSMLVAEDRRFFDAELEQQLKDFLGARTLFTDELLELANKSIDAGGLEQSEADRFIELATASFELSPEPVDRAWYDRLEAISSVASDIGGVPSTHINHLTPRVLDIDDLYVRMQARGITMIDTIQGPPKWEGPDVLLRQTSFRALDEPRTFREPDGSITTGDLRVRFGEVEARGIALTPAGRDHYDEMLGKVDQLTASSGTPREQAMVEVWQANCPASEEEILRTDYGYFNFAVAGRHGGTRQLPHDLMELLSQGWVTAEPIVYEDFLPRSAAGIFASNLKGEGAVDATRDETARDQQWMAANIGVTMYNPYELYAAEREESFAATMRTLGLDPDAVTTPWGRTTAEA